ncbi:MAG: PLDc N-terminal domain-containing protein [Nanoarchaeota archaeon]|nr:PLDc N-terminal domain-containing protein [DPANN group archaeon]MBL7116892.1 PLDc N-terminal domain-containing protein [Nanoarchaeota archaeon]
MIKKRISMFLLSLFLLMVFSLLINAQTDIQQQIEDAQQQMEEQQRQFDEQYKANLLAMEEGVNTGVKIVGVWMVIVVILSIASLAAFIWALVNILSASNSTGWKILWVIVCFFFGLLGVIIYVLVGKKSRVKDAAGAQPVQAQPAQQPPAQEQPTQEQPAAEQAAPAGKFCSACGAKLDAGVSFCSGCGAQQS